MPTIHIDGQAYDIVAGKNVLHVCLSLEIDVPYFCWHPAMGSVGACRLCAVTQFRDEEDMEGHIVMSCMTPAEDGTRISIDNPEATAFRQSVIEWLMINHPHDCPVCDEGGECHLQDMTLMTGHAYREYRFNKRTYRNQYLGPFVEHELNRCIQCYRCVRFYDDYAGGDDLQVFAAHDHVYFGRQEDGVLESEFSGNLVEVCPTGVFTDKTFKQHYTRKWDLQTAPSICHHCSVGCNTIPGERYGMLRRIRNRYNSEVNGYFLCDRGRYGYEFVNSDLRVRQPLLRADHEDVTVPATDEEVFARLTAILDRSRGVIGIGSPRASLEGNFALRRLVGAKRFYMGVSEQEARLLSTVIRILQNGPARSPSLAEIGQADAVLVLGEDLTNTAPMVDLALRQSVRQQPMQIARELDIPDWHDAAVREAIQDVKGPLFIATPTATKLDALATQTYRATPDDIARLGFAVAGTLNAGAPEVPDLPDAIRSLSEKIADTLKNAERPLIISGTSMGSEAVMQAAANVAWALCTDEQTADLSFTVPECNSMGLALMGGESIEAAAQAVQDGAADTVVVLENDLYRRTDTATVDVLLNGADQVIVLDYLDNATTAEADMVLPTGTFAESDGTLVNHEGRAQRFYQVFVPADSGIQENWRWVQDMLVAGGRTSEATWQKLDEIVHLLAEKLPAFAPVAEVAPPAGLRIADQKLSRQPHRYSGRTAMFANVTVHEPKPPDDPDSPMSFSMEGFHGQSPPALINEYWAPGWNSVQALNKFQQEVGGLLEGGDPPGRRLIEPSEETEASFFGEVPDPFAQRDGEWLAVPLYHIFGSEELSILAPGVAELAPQPYVGLHPDDVPDLRADAEAGVDVTLDNRTFRLPVIPIPSLPRGVVGIPVGLPDLPGLVLPAWTTVTTV